MRKKRHISLMLSVIMVLSLCFVPMDVSAADASVTIETEQDSYMAGETIVFNVTLNANDKEAEVKNKDTAITHIIYVNGVEYSIDTFDVYNIVLTTEQGVSTSYTDLDTARLAIAKKGVLTYSIAIVTDAEYFTESGTLYLEVDATKTEANGNTKAVANGVSSALTITPAEGIVIKSGSINDLGNNVELSPGTEAKTTFNLSCYDEISEDAPIDFDYTVTVTGGGTTAGISEITYGGLITESTGTSSMTSETGEVTVGFTIPDNGAGAIYQVTMDISYGDGKTSSYTVTITTGDDVDLEAEGITLELLETYYYGNVAIDATFQKDANYFYDATTFYAVLVDIKNSDGMDAAEEFYNQWIYDLYDPNTKSNTGTASDGYDDSGLDYDKDSYSPFHIATTADILPVDATLYETEDILVGKTSEEEAFYDMEKSVEVVDFNAREYEIDLEATVTLPQTVPVAIVFQIQTSWHMFDLTHANGVSTSNITTEMLTLYEMKQGFLEFAEWIQEKDYELSGTNDYGSSVLIGITNFQHDGSHSMLESPYFTNNMDTLISALYGWDTFGDCEHIHYSSAALELAYKALGTSSNFSAWLDDRGEDGSADPIFDSAELVSVIIGGACETNDLNTGNITVSNNIDTTYGIRTNDGDGIDYDTDTAYTGNYSWMDADYVQGDFDGGYFAGVTTRDEFVDVLKQIYNESSSVGQIADVVINDTIEDEFVVDADNITYSVSGVEYTCDTSKLTVTENADGTTSVSYEFGEVENGVKVELHIPITAQEDYLGSNNVYTNVGLAYIDYTGDDNEGYATSYRQYFEEEPKVNVKIAYDVTDGSETTVPIGTIVTLGNLDGTDIVEDIEDLMDNYTQISGTLTYQWYDEDGNYISNPVYVEVAYDKDNVYEGVYPSIYTGAVEVTEEFEDGKTYYLHITFTPDAVDEDTTGQVGTAVTRAGAVKVYSLEGPTITIYKSDYMQSPISGATFAMYDIDDLTEIDGEYVINSAEPVQEFTSGSTGTIIFTYPVNASIESPYDKVYLIKEIETASGYSLYDGYWILTYVDEDTDEDLDDGYLVLTDNDGEIVTANTDGYYNIINYKTYSLPNTGASGIILHMILGTILFCSGWILIFQDIEQRKRRRCT